MVRSKHRHALSRRVGSRSGLRNRRRTRVSFDRRRRGMGADDGRASSRHLRGDGMSSAGRGPTILTAGHGARSLDEFLAVLRDAGVHRLVDVRTAPGSRRHPQFGRDTLASALNQHGIAYAWKRDLGGFRIPKEDSPHAALRNRSFRGYADHMDTEAFHDSLVWLIQTSWEASTTVMCAE